MCTITCRNTKSIDVGMVQVPSGITWKDATDIIMEDLSLDKENFLCIPCGHTHVFDSNKLVLSDMEAIVQLQQIAVVFNIWPRRSTSCVSVPAGISIREIAEINRHLVSPGEEYVAMWDPTCSQYRNPLDIETTVDKMLKPIKIRIDMAPLPVTCEQDIYDKWPYSIKLITQTGDDMWRVDGEDTASYLVYRGNCRPLQVYKGSKQKQVALRKLLLSSMLGN